MNALKKFQNSPIPNWMMAAISAGMLADYLGRIDIAPTDQKTAYVAFAWAVMLGIWLSTAIYKTWIKGREIDG